MPIVNVHEAKTQLSRLFGAGREAGEEVVRRSPGFNPSGPARVLQGQEGQTSFRRHDRLGTSTCHRRFLRARCRKPELKLWEGG